MPDPLSTPGSGPAHVFSAPAPVVGAPGWIPVTAANNVFSYNPWLALNAALPTGPEPTPQRRIGARAIDLALEATVAIVIALNGPAGRPLVSGALAFLLIAAYEAVCVATAGATLGKRLIGLRVVAVGHEGPVSWAAACKRGAAIASVALASFASPAAGVALGLYLFVSVTASPHHRGGHDRASGTYVLDAAKRPRVVTDADLDRWIDTRHTRIWSALGLVATFSDRRRARARRLEQAPFLLAYLVVSTLAFVTIWQTLWAFVWLSLAWIVVFTVDETISIHRTGTTFGHREFGLVVIDRATGRPPGWVRAALRAFVLGLFMFTPLLPILALWAKVADDGRGPHDLIGHTAVITHPARAGRYALWPVPPTAPQFRF